MGRGTGRIWGPWLRAEGLTAALVERVERKKKKKKKKFASGDVLGSDSVRCRESCVVLGLRTSAVPST